MTGSVSLVHPGEKRRHFRTNEKGDLHHPYIIQQNDYPNEDKVPRAQTLAFMRSLHAWRSVHRSNQMHRNARTHQIPDYDSQITSAASSEADDVCNEDVSAYVCQNCHVWAGKLYPSQRNPKL
jgi:hypothetical protein